MRLVFQIKWEGRAREGVHTFSVVGIDCPIEEPSPFSPKWYAHKCKGAGVRYEAAVSLYTSKIIWIKGPFPCGEFPDAKIFHLFLKKELDKHEMGVADRGYRSISQLSTKMPHQQKAKRKFIGRILAQQETVNQRLKKFGCLCIKFRHDLKDHILYFKAVSVIVQLRLADDNPIYSL